MNIYVYAKKMEKEGENFYKELAEKTNNPGLKKILTFLVKEEVKHYNVLAKMSENDPNPFMPEETVFDDAKTIFSEMKDTLNLDDFEKSELSFYEKAREIEKKSYDFYTQKAGETTHERHKHLFHSIASEEKKHMQIIEGIIEFVSNPSQWLENAEWNNIGKYD